MVTTLYLIRHGDTEGDGVKRYHGSIDVPLSEKGVEQMRTTSAFVAEHLKNSVSSRNSSYLREVNGRAASGGIGTDYETSGVETAGLSAIYCSDLSRAIRSAGLIAGPHGLEPVIVPALRERSFGIWEGMSFADIKERYPGEFESWASDPVNHSPIEGETTVEVRDRAVPAMDGILRRHNGENIAVVAHGGINRIILCHILGIPLENIFRIEQDFGAVNVIEFWDRYPVVKLVNFRPE